jgi:hypothetical protein
MTHDSPQSNFDRIRPQPGFRSAPRRLARFALAASLCAVLPLVSGCDNAVQGGASGAGIGALSGLAIGSLSGNAGKGAVIGAVAGGLGGAVLGDQNRRTSERNNAQNSSASAGTGSTPPTGSVARADRDRLALTRLARAWRVTGWETIDGQRHLVSGTANGSVENAFFVRLTTVIRDDQSGQVNNGNIVFSSEPARGVTMTSYFDSAPWPMTFSGVVSDDGNVFTLNEIAPSADRRVVIRFINASQWVADISSRIDNTPHASLNFTSN